MMKSDSVAKASILERYEFIIPLLLFALFLVFTLPGISWGAPSTWHPDEVVVRSIKALHGEWKFSEINFNYPDLPQYVMFWLGKLILALGYSDTEILIASRVLSAVVAGLTILIVYLITRRAGSNIYVAGLSGLFLLCVSELANNGRFAHNDTYVTFFSTLAVFCLLEYNRTNQRGWLYASFFIVGMAASSKYTGGSLVLAPLTVYLFLQRKNLTKDWFSIGETLFISGALTFLGFALGTPKALTWMAFFFKRVFAALNWQVTWGRQDDSLRGIFGQYSLMENSLGAGLFLLFMLAFLWACYRIVWTVRRGSMNRTSREAVLTILLLSILALDLPIMISYNYQPRYFLTFMPLLAILAAFFIEAIYTWVKQFEKPVYSTALIVSLGVIVLYSFARLAGMALLFVNDSRISAGEFMKSLQPGSSLEHTNYPPTYADGFFEREHNYPLHFQMGADDTVPTDKPYEFNTAESGLLDRQTTYLIIDSYTADKFKNPHLCEQVQVECDFFKQLETGGSAHYQLIAEFNYELPWYLPQVFVTYANPEIRIYERIP